MTDLVKYQLPFNELPEGTVTFLFTDIEGSTQLLSQLRDQYATLLSDQRRIMRDAFGNWQGQEVDTQGDAFFVAFPRATSAVSATVEIQRALAGNTWPEEVEVRVRMGLHTGEPLKAEEGYVGMDVHRAARIAHVGHGGQVLLSETTAALIMDELPEGVELLDLGRHLLKDMRRPEHLRQLVIEGLPSEYPPLTSLEHLPSAELREPRQVGACPYRGLAAFGEDDAPFFHGREAFTDRLSEAVKIQPMVAVIVGSSGSGKSSTIFAGLLPRLRERGSWGIAVLRPGAQPFHALAGALLPQLDPALSVSDRLLETGKLAESLAAGEVSLLQVGVDVLDGNPAADRLLLVIDQFEELYTLCPQVENQRGFIDMLLTAVAAGRTHRESPLVILVTMRADFMGQALTHRPFADALQDASLIMGPMTRSELRRAIEAPAEQQGAIFEPGLVERILDDVGEEPGNLPLLEFALTLLWECQTDGWLTHDDYEVLGCVEGALASYADEVYAELVESERQGARRIFVQLVRPGDGTEDTRRIATFVEMGHENRGLVRHLADNRLVVTGRNEISGDETVEVVHEALIQRWHLLRNWMEADRAFRTWQERMRGALRGWEVSKGDDGALLRGAPLVEAEQWLDNRGEDLSTAEKDFIQKSIAMRERRVAEREQRRRRTIFALGGGLILSLVLVLLAIQQWQRASTAEMQEVAQRVTAEANADARSTQQAIAEREASLAFSRELAAAAISNLEVDPERSVLLALQGLMQAYTREAEIALHKSVPELHLLRTLTGHEQMVESIAISPDGTRLASASVQPEALVKVWDTATNREILSFPTHEEHDIYGLDYSPDGRILVTASDDFTARLWDATSGEELMVIDHGDKLSHVVFSPDGTRLATAGGDAAARVWDRSTGEQLFVLSGHEQAMRVGSIHPGGVVAVEFTPDGKRIATAGADGDVRIWDASDGKLLRIISGHTNEVYIALSPDGERLLTAGYDGLVKIWDISPATEISEPILTINHEQPARDVAFGPFGNLIATASQDGAARVWDAHSGDRLLTLVGHAGLIDDLVFTPDGAKLITGAEDQTIKVWDLAPGRELLTIVDGIPREVAYSPDGQRLATSHTDGTIAIWDSSTGRKLLTMDGKHEHGLVALEFSLDGELLASTSWDKTAKLWDARTGQELFNFTGHTDMVWQPALSPDGSRLATASQDETAKVWDTSSGQELFTLIGHDEEVQDIDYSLDGSRIATIGECDGTARIWDAASGQELMVLDHGTCLGAVAFSPNGDRLAVGGGDGSAIIWDISGAEGQILQTLSGHAAFIPRLAFSPDGKRLATASFDGTAKVWDLDTGQEWLTFHTQDAVTRAIFSPDGRNLATAGFDGRVRVWTLELEDLMALAESRLTRSLTMEECQKFLHMEECPEAP